MMHAKCDESLKGTVHMYAVEVLPNVSAGAALTVHVQLGPTARTEQLQQWSSVTSVVA